MAARRHECDEFYDALTPPDVKKKPDRARIMRQALAGMLWTKQYFYFDLDLWLREHHADPALHHSQRRRMRNDEWVSKCFCEHSSRRAKRPCFGTMVFRGEKRVTAYRL